MTLQESKFTTIFIQNVLLMSKTFNEMRCLQHKAPVFITHVVNENIFEQNIQKCKGAYCNNVSVIPHKRGAAKPFCCHIDKFFMRALLLFAQTHVKLIAMFIIVGRALVRRLLSSKPKIYANHRANFCFPCDPRHTCDILRQEHRP